MNIIYYNEKHKFSAVFCRYLGNCLLLALLQYINGKLFTNATYRCSSLRNRHLYFQKISSNKTVAARLRSKMDFELNSLQCQPACGQQPQALCRLAQLLLQQMDNETVNSAVRQCPHHCRSMRRKRGRGKTAHSSISP